MSGWIKLHRQMLEWEWYDDINVCRLFTHLLLKANHKDGRWKGIEIKAGSLVTGRHSLSEETGLTEQQIRTALKKLKSTGEITSKNTNKFSVISITSWSSFQMSNQQETQQATSKQPASNHKQECNNNKNEKKPNGSAAPHLPYADILSVYNEEMFDLVQHRKFPEKAKVKLKAIVKSDDRFKDPEAWRHFFKDVRKIPGKIEHLTSGSFGTLELIVRKFDDYYDQIMTLQRRNQL